MVGIADRSLSDPYPTSPEPRPMVFAVAPLAALWVGLSAFAESAPNNRADAAAIQRQIEFVDAAILAHRFRVGLDVPVADMATPVWLAGYRPGDIGDGRVNRAFLPVATPTPAQLQKSLADKLAELDRLRRDHPTP